ncbi:MAG: hypothetical protein J3Q66DRAFT_351824 [Benniella sp.]|nr:MAG: hypothetical protein J3Q66DRAFT_351824 [Benniella sp.]
MLKSLTTLLLLCACIAVSNAACVNRGAQNTVAYFKTTSYKCVKSCGQCEDPRGCISDLGGRCDTFHHFMCVTREPAVPAPAPVPVPAPLLAPSCVRYCGECQFGTRCQQDLDFCLDMGYPPTHTFVCNRR